MKKFLFLTSVFFSVSTLLAQGFSGHLEFKYYTLKDTTTNIYYVKDNAVKLDQYAKTGKEIIGSFIFDLTQGEIKFINPKRKVWGTQKSETPAVVRGNCTVSKTKNVKTISGLKCSEYIVQNVEENTSITYWISADKFNFFAPMMKLWNRKDKQSVYFAQIKDLPEGSMPLLSEEKQLSTNKVVSKLEVVKLSKTPPTEEELGVPKEYTKFEQ